MNNQFITRREETNNQYARKLSPLWKQSSDSRPYSRVKSVTSMRKKPWNRRFIYNKIPDYYQIKDKNIFLNKKPRVSSMHKNNVFDTNYITYQQSKLNYGKKKNIIRGFNRTSSGFFSQNSYMTNYNEFSMNNRNMISPLTNSALNRNNLMKENINLNLNVNSNDQNFNSIKKLWNELCVYMSYREVFIIIYNQLTGDEKEQFYEKEFNELNSVKNDIKNLNYYIDQRTLLLKDLYEQNIKLNRLKNSDDVINELLVEISNLIEKLREATIDVCYAMRKLKADMNIVSNLAKYDIDLLSSKSKFDKNYLIKMKGELSFLKEGNAKFFFNISEDRSPFLLKASDPSISNEKDMFMRIVPLKEEIKEHIKECNYYIYQELIAYQQNILSRKRMFRCVSPIRSNTKHMLSNSSFINIKDDMSQNNVLSYGTLNESNGFRRPNKNIFNDYPSDINSILCTNNFKDKKLGFGGLPSLGKQIPKINKDLFSQKLLWGFMPGDWGQEIFAEDEKVKDEKEEHQDNEEEEEDEEKSEDDTTRNELNELIEEKKSETEGNENSSNTKPNIKNNIEENNNINEENKEENKEQEMNIIDKSSSRNNKATKSKEGEDNVNINSNRNEDINKYLNNNNIEKKSSSLKSKKNSQYEENQNEKIILNNPINSNNWSEKNEEKKESLKTNNNNTQSDLNNNKKEEINSNNKLEENKNNNSENKKEENNN